MKQNEDPENTENEIKPRVKKADPGENKLMMLFYNVEERKHLKIMKEEENLEAFYKPISQRT